MEDISSIALLIFAILSVGIRVFRKAKAQSESEQPTPVKTYQNPVSINQEAEPELPISNTYGTPAMTEEPTKTERTAKRAEKTENPSISDDFDLAKAVIYSEILKPRTFDEY